MKKIQRHLISAVSLSAITLNLLLWIPALVVIALLKWLFKQQTLQNGFDYLVDRIYRAAVWFDSLWLEKVLGMTFEVDGELPGPEHQHCIIISNHRSWFDILILQALIVRDGPLLMFLIKQELIYVPVVGWICLALDFPRLNRGKSKQGRTEDYESVAIASQRHGALMNFAEGTRFTREKHHNQDSPYEHLLKPRNGGFRIMLANQPNSPVFDFTLGYPEEGLSFWQCLNGDHKKFRIHVAEYTADQVTNDPESWLTNRWTEKDQLLAQPVALNKNMNKS